MERSVLAQDVVLVVDPCLVHSVSLLVDALRQHVTMGCKQTAKLEWISREGAVKTVDLNLLRELFNRYTIICQFYLRATIKGVACPARLLKPVADGGVNRAAAALVEPSASVPQTKAGSAVIEAVTRQATGNVGGVKPAGNVGVEPDAADVRKSASAIVRRAATAIGHLAGGNALVKRIDAGGGNVLFQPAAAGNVLVKPFVVSGGKALVKRTDAGGGNVLVQPAAAAAGNVLVKYPAVSGGNAIVKRTDVAGGNALIKRTDATGGNALVQPTTATADGDPNLGISEDIQTAFPSVSPLKNLSKNRGKNLEKKTIPKISTPQKTTRTNNTSMETTPKKKTPKKMNTKETTPKKKSTPCKKQAKTTPKKDDAVDIIQLDSDDDFLEIEAEMEQEEMDVRAVRLASAHPAQVLGENFPTQSLDWNVVEVESMDGEGLNQPMAEDLMCNLLGTEDHAEEEAAPLSDVDEVSEHELVLPKMGDDEIGESLLEGATIPLDDEVTSELVITYDPDQPVIRVGTYFANMDEFRKAFGQFCINGEFDVHRYRNTKERKRKPRCKTTDAAFVLHDEARFEWTDDDKETDSDWPDIPKPSEPSYKKGRKLSPRRKKIVETPQMSGQLKKKARMEVVG
ncbi:hypothetical protein ACQ4PT_070379 [Festuca glaucescens]